MSGDPGPERDALRAVQEAIAIPYPAAEGDGETYREILAARILHVRSFLDSILDEPNAAHTTWSTGYLRDRLAEHPAAGYRTWSEAVAETRAREAAAQQEAEAEAGG